MGGANNKFAIRAPLYVIVCEGLGIAEHALISMCLKLTYSTDVHASASRLLVLLL